jgi:hypothetical protein
MDTKDLHLSVVLGLHLQMAVMMLDLRANPVLHEEQKMSNLPTYQFVSVFAQIQGSDKAIILFRNGRDCPAILHSPEFQPLSSSASHRPHSHSYRKRRPLGSNHNFEDCREGHDCRACRRTGSSVNWECRISGRSTSNSLLNNPRDLLRLYELQSLVGEEQLK